MESGGVSIQIEGRLDSESISALRDLCTGHLHKKKIQLNLEKVDRIDREGLDYLRSIRKQIQLDGLSSYLKLELDDTG
ncbi:MAG: hypothetical protein GY866_31570 [Proteobacteria bacterium]|nr:hypothetical protein [Pseudomonadota bacterium]